MSILLILLGLVVIGVDLNMPFLEIRYARNSEEKRILEIGLQNNQQIEIMKNTAVTDDTEDDELDG